jgi:predicted outer membrane protein
VKQYALDMVSNFEAAQKTIDSIALAYSLQLPATSDSVVESFRNSMMAMSRGKTFDTSFVGYQMRLHNRYLIDLTDAATNAKNATVKNFASGRIPIVTGFRNRADSLFTTL